MALDTVVQNIGEYYSAHYLDTTFERDIKLQLAKWRDAGSSSSPRRVQSLADEYFKAKSFALDISDPAKRLELRQDYKELYHWHANLLRALGYESLSRNDVSVDGGGSIVPSLGEVTRYGQPWLCIVETSFCLPDSSLAEGRLSEDPLELAPHFSQLSNPEDKKKLVVNQWSNAISRIFKNECSPRWIMLLAGSVVLLLDRKTYSQGRYLAFDLDDAFGRKERGAFECISAFLSAETLCPGADVPDVLHDKLEEQSHKFAHGVSERLQFAVREAIELLANEWVADRRRQSLSYTSLRPQELLPDGSKEVTAEHLRHEALIYVYRMLFCLYAEAHGGDLGILPISDEQYRLGYSFEALRDLELVPLSPAAEEGSYFHEHLKRLFKIIHEGFHPEGLSWSSQEMFVNARTKAFQVRPLTATLFDPDSTPLLAKARLTDRCLQQVVRKLSLTQDEKGKSRGRVNYAELGINQLGAVYEGLLSYKGMFAEQDLIQVKPKEKDIEDTKTPSWFVPKERLDEFDKDEVVRLKEDGPARIYTRGTFILHLSGIDREQSASYYTPEVLTKCLVEEALRELLKDYTPKDADKILGLKICEPAMGSGAFLNEAASQLAHKYLELKQVEINQRIDPTRYNDEHRRVKHYIASRNIYGVDLNPTAVELGSLSLWLGCMHRLLIKDGEGKDPDVFRVGATPWFGLRLRAGNSLIGARRAVWTIEQLKRGLFFGKDSEAPRLLKPGEARKSNEVYHFLVFDEDMIPTVSDRHLRNLYPSECEKAKQWLSKVAKEKWNDSELGEAVLVSRLIDEHWNHYAEKRSNDLRRTECIATIWPTPSNSEYALRAGPSLAEQETVRATLESNSGSFQRIKLVLDAWCSFWFWPIVDVDQLPSRESWLAALGLLLGDDIKSKERVAALSIRLGLDVDALIAASQKEIPDVDSIEGAVGWAGKVRTLARQQRFLHWELMFPEVLLERSAAGFDLVLGNPPWVRATWPELAILSEHEPLIGVRESNAQSIEQTRDKMLLDPAGRLVYGYFSCSSVGVSAFTGCDRIYPQLSDSSSNIYKHFIARSWSLLTNEGLTALIHEDGVFDDPGGGRFRAELYPRLRRRYQFRNELQLFAEVGHAKSFSINIYGKRTAQIEFKLICNLFHPITISLCDAAKDSPSPTPSEKDALGQWTLAGHHHRIIKIDEYALSLFAAVLEEGATPASESRLPRLHCIEFLTVLKRFQGYPERLGNLSARFSSFAGLDEKKAERDGILTKQNKPCFQAGNMEEFVISGPHFYVGTPFNKNPRTYCGSKGAYDELDLTAIEENFIPRSLFRPGNVRKDLQPFAQFQREVFGSNGDGKNQLRFRHVNRQRVVPSNERTLICALYPPLSLHVDGAYSLSFDDNHLLLRFHAVSLSLVADFLIRLCGTTHCRRDVLSLLPIPASPFAEPLINRALRLSCLTRAYAPLWNTCTPHGIVNDQWSTDDARLTNSIEAKWGALSPQSWIPSYALRSDFSRRQALLETDVLVALALGVSIDELLALYRIEFAVLYQYEKADEYDSTGRRLPNTVRKSAGGQELRTALSEWDGKSTVSVEWQCDDGKGSTRKSFYPPFLRVDREADYRRAYEFFKKRYV